MTPAKLVRMANQIAAFFRSQDEAAAPALVADHLLKFWDPRMRAALVRHNETGGEGLDAVAARAVALLAERAAT